MTFYQPKELPSLMVAPNGSQLMKKDHPVILMAISEIVITTKKCFEAGAEAMHFHVRDEKGQFE